MKRTVTFVLILALLTCALTAASGSVLAVEKDISVVKGNSVSLEIDLGTDPITSDVMLMGGELPPGMSLTAQNGRVVLSGTPSKAGNYKIVFEAAPDATDHTLHVTVKDSADGGKETSSEPTATPDPMTGTSPSDDKTPSGGTGTEATPSANAGTQSNTTGAPGDPNGTPADASGTPDGASGTPDDAAETPAPVEGPEITKHPGGETLSELGTAMFVSRANGASEIKWYLVSPQGVSYLAEEAEGMFIGLLVLGQGTETLALYSVPSGMNGWQAECRFKNEQGGESISTRATVAINTTLPAAPAVTRAPEDTFLLFGQSTTLSVGANAPDGNTIRYQWYQTTENNPATAMAIADATGAEYTPAEMDGTVYYCVGLRSVNNETVSTTAYTPLVAITYGSEPPVPDHIHDYGGVWYNDDIYHWQQCECGETTSPTTHTYSWTETVTPTARKQGERVGVCTVCGYETTQTIPAQRSQSSGRPSKTLLIALLMIVIAMLAFGMYYYTRTSGRRRPDPRRTGSGRRQQRVPLRPDDMAWQDDPGQWQVDSTGWPEDPGQWQTDNTAWPEDEYDR